MEMEKENKLLELARKRQSTRYEGYTSIGDYDNGVWECDYVSPYSKSSHNPDSDILIVLQDWCSSGSFDGSVCEVTLQLGYSPSVRTYRNLIALLREHFGLELPDVYTTNLFPYIKPGEMRADIENAAFVKAATDFTLPMIEIIEPKIVICAGLKTFNALRESCGFAWANNVAEGVVSDFDYKNSRIFCQAHPGQQGLNWRNRGGEDRVSADWLRMADYYRSL
jgi:restriction system protein